MAGENLQANLEAFRGFVAREQLTITAEREIPSGYQFTVTDGTSKTPISFYTTGKILIQGTPGTLQMKIKSWQQEQVATSALPAVSASIKSNPSESDPPVPSSGPASTHVFTTTHTGREARFHVPSDDIETVKQLLSGLSPHTLVEESPDQSLSFRVDIYRDKDRTKERVVARHYKNGTLQVQGKGELFDVVCRERCAVRPGQ